MLLSDLLDASAHDESSSGAGLLGRRALLGSMLAAAGTLALDEPAHAQAAPLALVYRGPASEPGTPEAVVAALRHRGAVRSAYVGPRQSRRLTAATLRGARLYVQPGGGSVEAAWPHLRPYRPPSLKSPSSCVAGHPSACCTAILSASAWPP